MLKRLMYVIIIYAFPLLCGEIFIPQEMAVLNMVRIHYILRDIVKR